MKALTVQQPWAWAIINGGKLIENRTQQWSYRGPLAIHAGTRWSDRGGDSPLVLRAWRDAIKAETVPPGEYSTVSLNWAARGAIIGVVDLVDVHPDAGCCAPWGESSYVEHGGRERRRIVHLVLENPRPLDEPIPCKGALGLWTPPADVRAELAESLGAIGRCDRCNASADELHRDALGHVCGACYDASPDKPRVYAKRGPMGERVDIALRPAHPVPRDERQSTHCEDYEDNGCTVDLCPQGCYVAIGMRDNTTEQETHR